MSSVLAKEQGTVRKKWTGRLPVALLYANTYPVAYGDFQRGYSLVDRIAMDMLRDPYTQATSGNIRFIFRRRMGGMVTMPEAIRKLKCSV